MTKILALLIGLALAGMAQGQIKCWTGADGKRACGDTPPPGVRLETPRGAPAPQAPAPAPAATDTKKATPAYAPQAQEIPRRQADPVRATASVSKERIPDMAQLQECARAQELLKAMGGGGRSKRTDAVRARSLADRNC